MPQPVGTPNVEPVMVTLFNLLQTAPGFKTYTRRFKLWKDVPKEDQPWLCLAEHSEDAQHEPRALPNKTELDPYIYIYIWAGEKDDPVQNGGTQLNNLIFAIRSVLFPPGMPDNVQSLGRLVNYCRIEGKILKDPGDIGGQGMARIPMKILIP